MFHYYIKGLYFHWIISVKGQEVESLVDIIDHFIVKGVSLRISCEHLGWFINQNLLWMLQSCKGFGWDMTGKGLVGINCQGVKLDPLPRCTYFLVQRNLLPIHIFDEVHSLSSNGKGSNTGFYNW